jgi:hypothetical protein
VLWPEYKQKRKTEALPTQTLPSRGGQGPFLNAVDLERIVELGLRTHPTLQLWAGIFNDKKLLGRKEG